MTTSESHYQQSPIDEADIEGLDEADASWGDYPIDELLIRHETRTIFDVNRRIGQNNYIMDPDFQRDFIWPKDKQSKLIESVIMRIPLPVFYLAEDDRGRMVVVDGLQRLSTFQQFFDGKLKLDLPGREELHHKSFSDLSPKLQNRLEDFNLIFYIIDPKVPERARLDIFERVNGGIPLTRQQMRNCLFLGPATHFLKDEARTEIFINATGRSLNAKTMRDREFVNRFCAFNILGTDQYKGDMDEFLANSLRQMNSYNKSQLTELSQGLRRSLTNNFNLFKRHAFRKSTVDSTNRSVLNASLWDVLSVTLSKCSEQSVLDHADEIRMRTRKLLQNEAFAAAISISPNDAQKVRTRFSLANQLLPSGLV